MLPADVYGEETLGCCAPSSSCSAAVSSHGTSAGFRAAAERELGLIESALIPVSRRKDVSVGPRPRNSRREIAGQLEVVRGSLIRSALQAELVP